MSQCVFQSQSIKYLLETCRKGLCPIYIDIDFYCVSIRCLRNTSLIRWCLKCPSYIKILSTRWLSLYKDCFCFHALVILNRINLSREFGHSYHQTSIIITTSDILYWCGHHKATCWAKFKKLTGNGWVKCLRVFGLGWMVNW